MMWSSAKWKRYFSQVAFLGVISLTLGGCTDISTMMMPSKVSSGVHSVEREQVAYRSPSDRLLRLSGRGYTELREPVRRPSDFGRTLSTRTPSSTIPAHQATLPSSKRTLIEPNSKPPTSTLSSESTGGFVTPVVGSEEWDKQASDNETRNRALNKQIYGICRGC